MFEKIISRQQKLPLAGKDLNSLSISENSRCNVAFHQCFHRLPRQTQSSVVEIQYHFEIITCTPSIYNRPQDKCVTENYFSYFSTKTYVVGTQKNCLNETALLSTQNMCFD